MDLIWIWTIIFVLAVVVEFITMEMVSIWIALGALVGLILSAIGGIGLEIQILSACLVAIVSILLLRKFALRYLHKTKDKKSAEVLIGKTCKVLEDITPEKSGTVKFNGVVWTATSDQTLEKGAQVVIEEVNGNKLKVKGE